MVRGDTKPFKDLIKTVPGYKFGYYGGVPGWMFPAAQEPAVRKTLGIQGPYVAGPAPSARDKSYGGSQVAQAPVAYQPSSIPGVSAATAALLLDTPAVQTSPPRALAPTQGGLRGPVDDREDESMPEWYGKVAEDQKSREELALTQKAQEAKISALEAKNSVLENKVATLEALVQELMVKVNSFEVVPTV